MRVNEVLETISEKEIITIIIGNLCISACKKDILNDSNFIKRRLGDCIVAHLGICYTPRGCGIVIECSTNEDYEVNEDDS